MNVVPNLSDTYDLSHYCLSVVLGVTLAFTASTYSEWRPNVSFVGMLVLQPQYGPKQILRTFIDYIV